MNPLKTLFNKVFDLTPPSSATANASKEDAAFEWNPEEETVAATTAAATSWKRGNTEDGATRIPGEAIHADIAASAHNLPTPMFEKKTDMFRRREEPSPAPAPGPGTLAPLDRPAWNEAPAIPRPSPAAVPSSLEVPSSLKDPTPPLSAPSALSPLTAQPLVPLSDFEDVYRKAGIKSPVHGYGVERVYRLLTSRRLVGLDRSVRRSALLTALDAAGVPPSDVSQDAVLRRKALTAYEAEKALELQSLRSRNESRAEALQDTVETFTRQKQSQIERLAQGSTSAVRAQSDLEIRKRMEQDRLYRSLAYFVEALPSPAGEARVALPEGPRPGQRLDATIDMLPIPREDASSRVVDVEVSSPVATETRTPKSGVHAATVTPAKDSPPEDPRLADSRNDDSRNDTRPISQSGLEMALRAAAETRTAGRPDSPGALKEPGGVKKPGSGS